MHDPGDALTDLEATADALLEVDLVITVDTMLAHLAGALGRPVWTLPAFAPDMRWMLDRADTPWYPTMRLFRQPAPHDWAGAFREVCRELISGPGFNHLVVARHGYVLYNVNDRYVGRSIEHYGEWSPGETALFRQFCRPGHYVVDVGAHIGTHTLAFARGCCPFRERPAPEVPSHRRPPGRLL